MLQHTGKISKHRYKIWAVGYTLWLTAVSLTPLKGLNLPSFHYADKIVHFFLYFFLTLFWILACPKLRLKKILLFSLAVLLGIIIELLQEYYVPNRTGDVFDALANTIGAFSGLFFYQKLQNYFR